jgi:hypothetical protein
MMKEFRMTFRRRLVVVAVVTVALIAVAAIAYIGISLTL